MDLFKGKTHVPGELIRLIRSIKGIKQIAAGKNAAVCQQAISKLERSEKVGINKFLEIAASFNCTQEEVEKVIGLLPPPPIKFSLRLNKYASYCMLTLLQSRYYWQLV
jgi:transcriptional regulator with XRE-family HTH domain